MGAVVNSVFYNANYNEGSPNGKYKYCWGVKTLDFDKDLQSQILPDTDNVFNFNLTSIYIVNVPDDTPNAELVKALRVAVDTAYNYDANGVIDLEQPEGFMQAVKILEQHEGK